MKKLMKGLLITGLGLALLALAPLSTKAQDDYDYATKQKERAHKNKTVKKQKSMVAEMPNSEQYNYTYYEYNPSSDYYYYRYQYLYPRPALPVTQNYVPTDVVATIRNTYGADLYDITTLTCADGQACYNVRVIRNGVVEDVLVNSSGATVMP